MFAVDINKGNFKEEVMGSDRPVLLDLWAPWCGPCRMMAPIVEEILCRGIVFRLAKHVSVKFWVANVIQALLFGVLHANLVQGTYAFVFGLVLGYVYGKYERIWMCMLLHGVINFSSAIVSLLWGMLFLAGRWLAMTFMVVAMAAAVAGILYCIKEELGPVAKVQGGGGDIQIGAGRN